ncbi:sulfatase-like hydrolase/transferase [Dokdonella sp.]|uniref:sulfatase-like hydrolase/transferase n=1 Tax=Dokdonella sp. TaxID=2291710 RepID=UPI003527804E
MQQHSRYQLPDSTPVLLITVDTLRPDTLGWVSGDNATPHIDALARGGAAFADAVSQTPLTLPSHSSMMSGRNPARHGIRDNGQILPASVDVLATRLNEAGYSTGAFVSAYVLRAMFGLDRGFDHYDDELTSGAEGWLDRPAGQTIDRVLPWIRAQRGKPWFAWIHLYDPHTPYAPPAGFEGTDAFSNYQGEVRYVDQELGRLLEAVEGLDPKPLIVLTADHAEAFGEHGEFEHGLFIYDTTTLVPLIFNHPAIAAAQPGYQPRLIDIAPTILDLLGKPGLAGSDGISLVPLLFGKTRETPPAYSETFHPWTTYGWSPLAALHDGGWKVIDGPVPELYNLAIDPGEQNDLAADQPARTDRMILELDPSRSPGDLIDSTRIEDNATMQKLASLGYLGSASTASVPTSGLPNPANMLKERAILLRAESLLRSNRLEQALAAFDEVLQTDPRNRFATLRSGISLLKLNRLPEAVMRLKASLALDPSQAETHYALADALTRSQQFEEAAEQWMETVKLQPRRAAAWGNLALVLSTMNRDEEARRAIHTALEIEPDDVRLLQNLAIQQRKEGLTAEMIKTLERAASVGGDEFTLKALYGLELYDLGRIEDAEPWLRKVESNEANYAESRFRLAQISLRNGHKEKAALLLDQAIQSNPALLPVAKSDKQLSGLLTESTEAHRDGRNTHKGQ